MPHRKLFTIGYEGADLTSFLATLVAAGVEQVLDVRELPQSRKAGFSKVALGAALEKEGIRYRHLRDLGDPKPGRDAARRGDHRGFLRIYGRHLQGQPAQAALAEAGGLASALTSCLLCFEREHEACHRAVVAAEMAVRQGFRVSHLRVTLPSERSSVRGSNERNPAEVG